MSELLQPPGTSTEDSSGTKANVLLVDDNPANLLALSAILEDLGQPSGRGSTSGRDRRKDEFLAALAPRFVTPWLLSATRFKS